MPITIPTLSEAEAAFLDAIREQMPEGVDVRISHEGDPLGVAPMIVLAVKFGAYVPVSSAVVEDAAMRPSVVAHVAKSLKMSLAGAMRPFIEKLEGNHA